MVEPDVQARSDLATTGHRDINRRSGRPAFLRFNRQDSPERQARNAPRNSNRASIFRVLKRLWIPLVILVVVAAGGFTVARLHNVFGSEKRPSYADTKIKDTKPYNPKHLRYEVFGPPGTVASISYFDVNADPRHVDAHLPWSIDISTTEATAVGSVTAQGDSDSIGCRITVDGEVKAERISDEVNAFTFCLLKSA